MTAVKADDDFGWADFASFDSKDSDSTFASNRLTLSDSDNNGIETVAKPCSETTSPRTLLQGIFESTETGIQANSKLNSVTCLESRILHSKVWNNCNSWNNLELMSSVNLDNSSWQSSFIDSVKGFLEDKDSEACRLIPEKLEISSFIHCFNFHKFSHHGKRSKSNQRTEVSQQNKSQATNINPFPANKLDDCKHWQSSNSIVESSNILSSNSAENLVVKEIDNISITSTESSCSGIIIDGSDESNSDSRILEKWKQIRRESIAQGKPGLECFSLEELQTLAGEIRLARNTLSESLVKELKLKDELCRERERRDNFISLLLVISRKQKSQEVSQANRRQRILFHVTSNADNSDNKFLDVSIPYVPAEYGPSPEAIRSLTTILQAMLDEDPKVPSLVTEYTMNIIKELQESS
ncbi:uncharacterized protein LOC135694116 [Rhopilema esculentum]|uniref:uncharacterized protein LOC135694116 n=1 Tax=Rhopilema esculentum TaxID=499914 RepID=UPI0031D08A8D